MKLFKKTLCVLLAALLLGCTALIAFAADGDVTVSLRVEGLDKCLFYDNVTVPADASALDALKAADAASDALTLTVTESEYGAYLAAINGLYAGSLTAKGWDGWMFRVNDEAISVGIDAYKVKANDAVVVYYSDEYGDYGMLYPVLDEAGLGEGKVSFTATVTEYDENWNAVEKEVPVTGYTLIWDGEKITPDENGVATLSFGQMIGTEHSVQIERYVELKDADGKVTNVLPTVLRYAPDYTVKVSAANPLVKILTFFKDLFQKIAGLFGNLFKK